LAAALIVSRSTATLRAHRLRNSHEHEQVVAFFGD
jgi:hypothetical protein